MESEICLCHGMHMAIVPGSLWTSELGFEVVMDSEGAGI
jgi:hypothetical protein